MPELHGHHLLCPVCARPYSVSSPSVLDPVSLPCGACWRNLRPSMRGQWLRELRREPEERRVLAHRDPVPFAPPPLRAYVEVLEAELRGFQR